MAIEFSLTQEQTDRFRAWRDDPDIHERCAVVESGTAIGGSITFSFTHVSLGTIAKAYCSICKHEIDLTEYDDW